MTTEGLDAAVQEAGPDGGLLARGRRFVGALLEHVATRGELLAVEVAEEKQRLIHAFIAEGLLLLSAIMALAFLGMWLVVLAWDTDHRNLVAFLIWVVFLAIAGGCWLWLRKLVSRKTALFRDSLRELHQDADALRR